MDRQQQQDLQAIWIQASYLWPNLQPQRLGQDYPQLLQGSMWGGLSGVAKERVRPTRNGAGKRDGVGADGDRRRRQHLGHRPSGQQSLWAGQVDDGLGESVGAAVEGGGAWGDGAVVGKKGY